MLDEFRLAEAVAGRMEPEEVGRCYLRLKHAIDGGFRVVEATAERIVLVNDRCPFGEAVQQAPSLCRMTSSVFGGIAARNSEGGASRNGSLSATQDGLMARRYRHLPRVGYCAIDLDEGHQANHVDHRAC